MIRRVNLDLAQLRLLSQVLVAEAPAAADDEIAPMPPLLASLLDQAQHQGPGPYVLELEDEGARTLFTALEGLLDDMAASGDILALGELHHMLAQLDG